MDQLRTILGWLKRQHFWVLSVLVAAIALFCWWKGSGRLSTEFKANQSTITNEFNALKNLREEPFHANTVINEKQLEEAKKQTEQVKAIWERLYDRQRENVLEWPASLKEEFREFVKDKKFGDQIPGNLRDNYRDYIDRHFERLPEKIGARALQAGEGGLGEGGGRGGFSRSRMMEEGPVGDGSMPVDDSDDYIVEWVDQAHVRDELYFPVRPSALKIWVTQENLWVYHTLLNVIANTNSQAGADRKANAAIRAVYSLQVGRDAAQFARESGRIYMVPSALPAATEGGGELGMEGGGGREAGMSTGPRDFSSMEGRFGQGGAALTEAQEQEMLLSWRYLDASKNPIAVGGGGEAMGGEDGGMAAAEPVVAPGPTTFGVEYKRLPVRMILEMDQRWLPYFIAECASQPLQVEVQQVRVNPPGLGDMSSGMGGRGFEGGGGGRGGGFEGGPGGALAPPTITGIQTFPQQPHLATIVIQGIIYIFNEPNMDVLQSPGGESGGEAGGDLVGM